MKTLLEPAESIASVALAAPEGVPPSSNDASPLAAPRKRGRPLEMAPRDVLELIRDLGRNGGLYRVHLSEPALYARARRLFGTWAKAVEAAGLRYSDAVHEARRRSQETRRRLREPRRPEQL